MAVYVDYTFYSGTYKGTAIAQAAFDTLALRASEIIDAITFLQAPVIVEADEDADTIALIKMATCAVADELQAIESGPEIQSERVGNHSVSYAVVTPKVKMTRCKTAAKTYLWDTDLMYGGL